METICDSKQIQGLVKERNEYRRLLQRSLNAFNVLRNQRISESLNDTTYALASEIGSAFKRFDQGISDSTNVSLHKSIRGKQPAVIGM